MHALSPNCFENTHPIQTTKKPLSGLVANPVKGFVVLAEQNTLHHKPPKSPKGKPIKLLGSD
jgi:hypothetical protein